MNITIQRRYLTGGHLGEMVVHVGWIPFPISALVCRVCVCMCVSVCVCVGLCGSLFAVKLPQLVDTLVERGQCQCLFGQNVE